jgi:hypothetical protein
MKIKEINTPDAAAAEKDYYTKDEIQSAFDKAMNFILDATKENTDAMFDDYFYLKRRIEQLENTVKELEEQVDRYLLKEKEARKRAALERLNSGFYDFEEEEEEEEEEEKN